MFFKQDSGFPEKLEEIEGSFDSLKAMFFKQKNSLPKKLEEIEVSFDSLK